MNTGSSNNDNNNDEQNNVLDSTSVDASTPSTTRKSRRILGQKPIPLNISAKDCKPFSRLRVLLAKDFVGGRAKYNTSNPIKLDDFDDDDDAEDEDDDDDDDDDDNDDDDDEEQCSNNDHNLHCDEYYDIAEEDINSKSTQTQKITLQDELIGKLHNDDRTKVKERIVKAYDLYKAAIAMQQILNNNNTGNEIVKETLEKNIREYKDEINEILNTPEDLLIDHFEKHLLQFVKYLIDNYNNIENQGIVKVYGNNNKTLNHWLQNQRERMAQLLDNKMPPRRNKEIETLHLKLLHERLNVIIRKYRQTSYDEYMVELREYKKKHGHVTVPQRLQNNEYNRLGEFVQRLRKEYDSLQKFPNKKVSNLTPERIEELNSLGFIWRIRADRPRKGDANFRLRRKSNKSNSNTENSNTNSNDNNPSSSSKEQQQQHIDMDMNANTTTYKSTPNNVTNYQNNNNNEMDDATESSSTDDSMNWDSPQANSNGKETTRTKNNNHSIRKKWKLNFDKLATYQKSDGTYPKPIPDDDLRVWLIRQRTEYRKKLRGKSTSLSDEKEDLLRSIGITFNMNNNNNNNIPPSTNEQHKQSNSEEDNDDES